MTRFWVACLSKEYILRGTEGRFIQVCHGKQSPLKRMSKGDFIVIYSSKISMNDKDKYQKFTAIGEVADDKIYPIEMSEDFIPFRRNIRFLACEEYPIISLISDLDFIENKGKWGYPFRYGFFEITEKDFRAIASKMVTDEK